MLNSFALTLSGHDFSSVYIIICIIYAAITICQSFTSADILSFPLMHVIEDSLCFLLFVPQRHSINKADSTFTNLPLKITSKLFSLLTFVIIPLR